MRDYVEAHLGDDLSLTMLAGIACLSPYHFSRSFKQAAGVGPQRYVIQRRVERAKYLLRQTHQPLALIAQETGFGDQSHLTQMFRREIGVTPGRFRAALASPAGTPSRLLDSITAVAQAALRIPRCAAVIAWCRASVSAPISRASIGTVSNASSIAVFRHYPNRTRATYQQSCARREASVKSGLSLNPVSRD
jgi:AraC-like DNA-binding protein